MIDNLAAFTKTVGGSLYGFRESLSMMSGGGGKDAAMNFGGFFGVMLIFFINIIIKSYLIQITYNSAIPTIINSVNTSEKREFRPIAFKDSIMIAILAMTLFH
jgi:hypothetical protein